MAGILLVMLCAATLAAVPLSESQQIQLDSASDFTRRFDEGALYPLLHNALQRRARDDSGAVVPDYPFILQSPAEHRGQLFLIEGLFAGVPTGGSLEVARLTRPGPWDDKLQQWVIVVDQAKDEVAVVYLVDPPPAPAAGTQVRLAARFYKVLADVDRNRQPTNYLTFVGKDVTVASADPAVRTPWGAGPLFGLLLLLAVGWFLLRRNLGKKPVRSKQNGTTVEPAALSQNAMDISLPEDPAQALQALNQMHDEQER